MNAPKSRIASQSLFTILYIHITTPRNINITTVKAPSYLHIRCVLQLLSPNAVPVKCQSPKSTQKQLYCSQHAGPSLRLKLICKGNRLFQSLWLLNLPVQVQRGQFPQVLLLVRDHHPQLAHELLQLHAKQVHQGLKYVLFVIEVCFQC